MAISAGRLEEATTMTRAYIGVGSNWGDRLATIGGAVAALEELDETRVEAVSHVYESEPWGEADQPPFANAVVAVDTELRADQLMEDLHQIEDKFGRKREVRYGPRTIDLDILLFGDEEWTLPDLTIPHPRMAERDFVITPLLEIAPDVKWPDGTFVTRSAVNVGSVTRILGPMPDEEAEEGLPPLAEDDWVVVAEGVTIPVDTSLQFKQLVLDQADIPFSWDPFPPGEETQPWGMPTPIKLVVPADRAEEARFLLAEAERAPIAEEDRATEEQSE
jgi:2-amino-4-hydroxy-6-hydroxymethyldihydropteridine diphosphokinase